MANLLLKFLLLQPQFLSDHEILTSSCIWVKCWVNYINKKVATHLQQPHTKHRSVDTGQEYIYMQTDTHIQESPIFNVMTFKWSINPLASYRIFITCSSIHCRLSLLVCLNCSNVEHHNTADWGGLRLCLAISDARSRCCTTQRWIS